MSPLLLAVWLLIETKLTQKTENVEREREKERAVLND